MPPMLMTLLGMVTLVNWVQYPKAWYPMLVTPLRIVTFLRLLQKENAAWSYGDDAAGYRDASQAGAIKKG